MSFDTSPRGDPQPNFNYGKPLAWPAALSHLIVHVPKVLFPCWATRRQNVQLEMFGSLRFKCPAWTHLKNSLIISWTLSGELHG